MQKLFILLLVMSCAIMACNNDSSGGSPVASSSVDSATKAAPDTIRPSMDTTAKKHI